MMGGTTRRRRAARAVVVAVCSLPLIAAGISGAGASSQSPTGALIAQQATDAAGVIDHVDLGDAGSEDAHDVIAEGTSEATGGAVEQGQLTEGFRARSVSAGGRFEVDLDVHPGLPLTLQLREVRPNDAWGAAFGFRVYLDGELAYVRDDETSDAGGGVYQSFFVDTHDREILRDRTVTVTIEGTSDEPAFFADIWAYADLESMLDQHDMRVPDQLVFVLGNNATSNAGLRQRLDYIQANFNETDQVKLGFAVLDRFPTLTPARMAQDYQRWLDLSREYDLPFAIESTSDWAGTPRSVSDGKGGFFGDLEYQQVLWSPQDQTGPDEDIYTNPAGQVQRLDEFLGDAYEPRHGLSVPNVWSNTPWLTWHHPDLNAFYADKTNQSTDQIRPLVWDLQRTGEVDRVLPFSTATESVYWSRQNGDGVWDINYTPHNHGVERLDISADLNPYAVAAAAEDGVVLDPTDGGWSEDAKAWLYKNQSHHQQFFTDLFYDGLPRERITASEDELEFPADMLRHNIHSEIYSRKQEPYWSDIYPSSAQGVVERGRPGSQFISLDDVFSLGGFYHLQKLREFGRIANPNLENAVSPHAPDKTVLLRQAYVNGSRYTTPYNWVMGGDDDAAGWIAPFIDDMTPWDVVHDASPDGQITDEKAVTQTFTAGELRLANRIDVQLERVGPPAPLRLTLHEGDTTDGRVVTMRRLSGTEIRPGGWVPFYLPIEQLDRDQVYTVHVEQVDGEQAAYTFPTTGGDLLYRVGLDMDHERDRSMVITWRRDAADAIRHVGDDITPADTHAAATLADAEQALAEDRYVDAYQLAIKADSLRFPVLYQSTGAATLDPFPLTVESPFDLDLDLDVTSFEAERELTFTAAGYDAGAVTVRVRDFADPHVLVDDQPVEFTRQGVWTVFELELTDTVRPEVRVVSGEEADR